MALVGQKTIVLENFQGKRTTGNLSAMSQDNLLRCDDVTRTGEGPIITAPTPSVLFVANPSDGIINAIYDFQRSVDRKQFLIFQQSTSLHRYLKYVPVPALTPEHILLDALSQIISVSVVAVPASIAVSSTSLCTATVVGSGPFDPSVTWSVLSGGGSITSGGLYTAPSTATTAIIAATSVQDPSKSGTVTINVFINAVTLVSVAAVPVNILVSQTSTCTATVTGVGTFSTAVTWSIDSGGGSINSSGIYTAPSTPTTAVVRATSVGDPTKSGTAVINVTAAVVSLSSIILNLNGSAVTMGPTLTGNSGDVDNLFCVGLYSDGSHADLTSIVVWTVTPGQTWVTLDATPGEIVLSNSTTHTQIAVVRASYSGLNVALTVHVVGGP